MKNVFVASLCRNGILGGGLYVDSEKVTYRTEKLTVPPAYKNLEMHLSDIISVREGWMLCFPTVTFQMKNGENYKFIVFARNRFLRTLEELGVER